jgi:hypothetical protein
VPLVASAIRELSPFIPNHSVIIGGVWTVPGADVLPLTSSKLVKGDMAPWDLQKDSKCPALTRPLTRIHLRCASASHGTVPRIAWQSCEAPHQ